MRPSRMLLIAALAVLSSLMPGASPALAQSSGDIPPVGACDQAVCMTVSVVSPTQLDISAGAELPAGTCGHFQATVTGSNWVVRARSAATCLTAPTWWSGVTVPTTNHVTVTVKFISDTATLGAPTVYL
jgi:hypothetical protein